MTEQEAIDLLKNGDLLDLVCRDDLDEILKAASEALGIDIDKKGFMDD